MLRQATNRSGIQLCVKTLQMTMTRARTLEMTEDWTHSHHDKACVIQSTVEHNVASEHFNSSLAHITARTSQAKHASLEDDVAREKNAVERPFYGRGSCNEKKTKKSQKTPTHRQLSSDSSATFVPRQIPSGDFPRTAHIAISPSVAKSQDSSISEVYFPTTLCKSPYGCEGI